MSESPLRTELESAMSEHGLTMQSLTVMEKRLDPYRLDTPSNHSNGRWLADTLRELGYEHRVIHLRGVHYMVLGRPKPDGTAYTNTEKDWSWLVEDAGKAARWLGYIDWERIVDERNADPVVRVHAPVDEPWPYLRTKIRVDIPDVTNVRPIVDVEDFYGVQPYKIVFAGEKSSLGTVLGPLAERYDADLYLPTGYMSQTLAHHMAKTAAEDGRRMVLFYFADCDPDGWNMPVVVARTLQAFKTTLFPQLDFEVHRVGLTPDQVRAFGLPSTPFKASNVRADAWQRAMGVQQTEIDALASLRPELLQQITHEAVGAFFDNTLDQRVTAAKREWCRQAQAIVDDAVNQEHLGRIRAQAAGKLAELEDEIRVINDALKIDASDFELPNPVVPEARLDVGGGVKTPLLDSRWSFAEQTMRLIESKSYSGESS